MVKMNSIVDVIGLITEEDGEAGIAASRKPRVLKRDTSPRAGSDYHLGILSAPRALMDTEMWPDYEFDTRLGQGHTIYIIDTGYRATHEVIMFDSGHMSDMLILLRNSQRQVGLWTVTWFPTLSRSQSRNSSGLKTHCPLKT
jgi:hypothetical protein